MGLSLVSASQHNWYIVSRDTWMVWLHSFDCGTQGLICMPPVVQILLLLSSSYSTGPFLNEVATNLPTARYMPILLKNCYLFKYSFRFAIHFLLWVWINYITRHFLFDWDGFLYKSLIVHSSQLRSFNFIMTNDNVCCILVPNFWARLFSFVRFGFLILLLYHYISSQTRYILLC